MTLQLSFSVFRNEKDNQPTRGDGTWEELEASLRNVRIAECTLSTCERSNCIHKYGHAWSAAVWPPNHYRAKGTVESVCALVIDIDHIPSDAELAEAMSGLTGYQRIIHASHSDKDGDRCVRVVVALSRPVLGSEWPRFWLSAMSSLGIPADPATKDASRLYFFPSRPTGASFYYESLPGIVLDVEAILAAAAPEAPILPQEARILVPPADAPAQLAAVYAIGAAWPRARELGGKGGRHLAGVALCGALARAGWDAETIADFVSSVAELAEPGNAEEDKWLYTAEQSINKVDADEPVTGWPSLIPHIGEAAVSEARKHLGMAEDPNFLKNLLASSVARAPVISREDLHVKLKGAEKSWSRASGTSDKAVQKLRDAELLKSVNGRTPFTGTDEEVIVKARGAIEAIHRAAPAASTSDIADLMFGLFPCDNLAGLPVLIDTVRATVPEQKTAHTPIQIPGAPDPETDQEVRALLITTETGPKSCGSNIETILRFATDLRGHVRFNELTKLIEVTGGPFAGVKPNDLPVRLSNWLERSWGMFSGSREVGEQLLTVARTWYPFDPLEQYLRGLTWDGKPRIGDIKNKSWLETYCNAVTVDRDGKDISSYVRKVASRFLISAVARALRPGSKVDTVLVLEGEQGAKKSTALAVLGGAWFTDTPLNIGDKDSRMIAAARWLCELAELASLVRADVESQKAFISARRDDFRPPYGRAIEQFDRRCVFAGTMNPSKDGEVEYLIDETGDRRWWPVRVGHVDIEALTKDRDQLWAEAVARYDTGERWWFEREEQHEADDVAAQRHGEDPWVPMIIAWVQRQESVPQIGIGTTGPAQRSVWTLNEIAEGAIGIDKADMHRYKKMMAAALREAGFRTVRTIVGGKRGRYWTRREPEKAISVVEGDPEAGRPGVKA